MVAGFIKKIAVKKAKGMVRGWIDDNPGKVAASK
jgi:hypothetical protein